MAGRDSWNDDRWEDDRNRDRYEGRDRAPRRRDGPYAADRGFGHAPRLGATGIAASYNQAGDMGTSDRYYEDYEARAVYGGYEGGAPGYGAGAGRREGGRFGRGRRPDDATRPDYREHDPADDEVLGAYGDYGRTFSGYGAGGGYTPDYREGLARERRSWADKAGDEVKSWFGDANAERRRDWDAAAEGRGEHHHHRGRGPKGYTRSDERIREDVSDRLTDDPIVDASEIELTVSGGEVTLNGAVHSKTAKRRAEDVADSVTGVGHVQNNLRVSHMPQPGTLATQTDPRVAAVSEGRSADDAARDLRDDRGRLGALRPNA
jgi:osmotically-inducible protein OsmY